MAVSPAFGRSVGMSIDRPARRRRTVRERERRREGIEAGKYALMEGKMTRDDPEEELAGQGGEV